ncbi:unnamed protein product [Sphacelaria rigidula]
MYIYRAINMSRPATCIYIDRTIYHDTRHLKMYWPSNMLMRESTNMYLPCNILAAARGQHILIQYTQHPKRQYIFPSQYVVRECAQYIGRAKPEETEGHNAYCCSNI